MGLRACPFLLILMRMTLKQFWEKRLVREADKLSANTIKKHKAILSKVDKYDPDVQLTAVNLMWIMDLEAWLIERGNSKNTIATTMSALKSTMNQALDFDLIDKAPFKKYKISKGQTYEKALEMDDVKKLATHASTLVHGHKDRRVLDAWMFSFFAAGIRVSDLVLLTPDNLKGNKLEYVMRKNNKKVVLPLNKQALETLEPYLKECEAEGRQRIFGLVPDELGDKMSTVKHIDKATAKGNLVLKRIAKKLGIKKTTWHAARAAFATAAVRSGTDIDTVRQLLKHSSITTTQEYLASRTEDDLGDELDNIVSF